MEEAADTCEIARLPEELISAALSLTTPLDACRAGAVSRDFRAASDSDAAWSRFVPHDLPSLADGELSGPAPASTKGRFLRLSDHPFLLDDGLMSMWLDRETGAKCYMLSARALHISSGHIRRYWDWIPLPDSCRFSEGAKLLLVWELEIHGKIQSKMLSQDTTYAAYIVFKLSDKTSWLDYPAQEASITFAGRTSTRKVCLRSDINEDEDCAVTRKLCSRRYHTRKLCSRRYHRACCAYFLFPRKRTDGWMELKLGEFHIQDRDTAGEVCMNLTERKGRMSKAGLLVQGIEIRPKRGLVVGSFAHPLLSTNLAPTHLNRPKGHTINSNSSMSKFKQAATTLTIACEIVRLPQELLMKVLSYITPQDAGRVAAVSQAFRAIVDSDTFWSRFVPDIDGLLELAYVSRMDYFLQLSLSKKEMFLCLSDQPILLAYHRMSMWLDWQTGSKCYMLPARDLDIARVNNRKHWRWIPLSHCSFFEAAELQSVPWLEIRGQIDSKMLSLNSTYAAYIVFKLADESYEWDFFVLEASVRIGKCKSTREVCLHGDGRPFHPQRRADGWKEVEMGEFYNKEGNDGDVYIRLADTTKLHNKKGLIVYGIEIRPTK